MTRAGSQRFPIHDDEENLTTRLDDFFERITKDALVSFFNFKVLLDPFAIQRLEIGRKFRDETEQLLRLLKSDSISTSVIDW